MTTFVFAKLEQPKTFVTVRLYAPEAAVVTLVSTGLAPTAENPFGPAHEYVPLVPAPEPVRVSVAPLHGRPEVTTPGLEGRGLTVTLVTDDAVQPPAKVIVTVYAPLIAVVAIGRDTFCALPVKPPGPAHE